MKRAYDFITEDLWGLKCPYKMTPEFIVVHNTANDASAEREVTFMKKNPSQTSYHFAVDDVEIRQVVPTDRNAWHAGDGATGRGNRKGIAIEICYSLSGGEKFEAAENNAAQLISELLKKYSWTIDKVKKHQDFSGKYCPHRTLDMGWERFLKKVEGYMIEDLEEVDDIVWELSERGIIKNRELWLMKLEENEDAYWLAKKAANYIREM